MKSMSKGVLILLALLLWTAATMAQQSPAAKKGPAPTTLEPSGESLFNTYCAVCHGKDGKGNGPAAAALKAPPSDLTTLSQRHGGKFPTDYVSSVLEYGVENAKAHGTKDMPIWGPLLGPSGSLRKSQERPLAEEREADAMVAARIRSLTEHIESLQRK